MRLALLHELVELLRFTQKLGQQLVVAANEVDIGRELGLSLV